METSHPNIPRSIAATKKLEDETMQGLRLALEDFNMAFAA
jgi:hypothetical protein